jgi:hypothetical protein
MLIQIEYMGKTYLCSVMSDWVDMIEELGGETGAVSEANKFARLGTPTAPSPSQPRPRPPKNQNGFLCEIHGTSGLNSSQQ